MEEKFMKFSIKPLHESMQSKLNVFEEKQIKKNGKESSDKKDECMFVIDTTPSPIQNLDEIPSYTRWNEIILTESSIKNLEKSPMEAPFTNCCFNCSSQSHMLRECPEERNQGKIKRAKNGFSTKAERYYTDVLQRFDHLKPGKMSEQLRKALNLGRKEVPQIFYRMRVLGYPPGWLEEAKVTHSGIFLYDSQGNRVNDSNFPSDKGKQKYDVSKIIPFPGFNTSPGPNCRDDYRYYKVPRMSEKQDIVRFKENFGNNVVTGYKNKQLQNSRKTGNDLCANGILKDIPPKVIDLADQDNDSQELREIEERVQANPESEPPTLLIVQDKYKMLLFEPENSTTDIDEDFQKFVKDVATLEGCEESEIVEVRFLPNPKANKFLNLTNLENIKCPMVTGEINNLDSNPEDYVREHETSPTTTPTINPESENYASIIKNSQDIEMNETAIGANSTTTTIDNSNMAAEIASTKNQTIPGTPIIQFSPYENLPNYSEFSKGVSEVIYFENLPHSTGNYNQMKKVLLKVRQTISKLNENDC